MRLIVVSDDLPAVGGVCVGASIPFAQEVVKSIMAHVESVMTTRLTSGILQNLPMAGLSGAVRGAFRGAVGLDRQAMNRAFDAALQAVSDVVPDAIYRAYAEGLYEGSAKDSGSAIERISVGGCSVTQGVTLSNPRPFENQCISIGDLPLGSLPNGLSFSTALFHGHFQAQSHLEAALKVDGTNSRIHFFSRQVAKKLFRRQGGGVLEEGLFVLHPKREYTLVPFSSFHNDMLQEMNREIRVVMGKIGAKKLVTETLEGVTCSGQVVSRIPLKSGGLEVDAANTHERIISQEWGSPTFDPDHALEDCVWIRDNAAVMTIIDQRLTSNLVRFEEFSRVDTSFRVSVDLLSLMKTGFSWASESTYRYRVEFFPRT